MQNRRYAMIALAAAAASVPLGAKAATVSFAFDPTILVSPDGVTFTAASVTTSGINQTVTIAPGSFIEVSIDGNVTNNPNTAPTGAGTYQASNPTLVPAKLGLAAFQLGIVDNNPTAAGVESNGYWNGATSNTTQTTAAINANYGTPFPGTIDGLGGVSSNTGIFGGIVASSATTANLVYAAGAAGSNPSSSESLATVLYIGPNQGGAQVNGSAVFTLDTVNSASGYYTYKSGGTSASSKSAPTAPVYQTTTLSAADTLNFGTLTVVVGSASTGVTNHPIISLISNSSAPGSAYGGGSSDGTITMTGKGNGSYNVTTPVGFTATATGGITVVGFNPTNDTEIYALKLTSNGTTISGTQITTVINDINGTGTNTTAAAGVVASQVSGSVYSSIFNGYQILLTSTAGITDAAELNFDFAASDNQDSSVPNLVLTGAAAVPEPATAAGVVLGAAGLLLGRRRSRLMIT